MTGLTSSWRSTRSPIITSIPPVPFVIAIHPPNPNGVGVLTFATVTLTWRASGRVLTAIGVVVPFVTLASAIAPLPAHEPDDDHAPVVHSHFEFHGAGTHGSREAVIDHAVSHVVWLDNAVLHAPAF